MATLESIVSKVESEAGLPEKTISRRTVRHRVLTGNVDGTNAAQISPVADIEPLIADFCIRMARLGEPLTKSLVINLANDLISDTDYEERVKVFKARHKITDGNLGEYFSALQKMTKNVALNKDDMKVLLARHKHSQDSPIKSKVADIKVQFEARKERLQPFLDVINSTAENDKENETPVTA